MGERAVRAGWLGRPVTGRADCRIRLPLCVDIAVVRVGALLRNRGRVNRTRTSRTPRRRRQWPRLDVLSILLAPLGIAVVAAGHLLDGSQLASIVQGPSALI